MRCQILIFLFGLAFGVSGCARHADRAAAPLPELVFHKPTKAITEERLELKVVSTEQSRGRFTHEVFLGKQKFRSFEALIVALGKLPKGTEVYYDCSCLGVPNRPLNHHEELVAFQQRCEKMGVVLVLEYNTQQGRVKRMAAIEPKTGYYSVSSEGKGLVLMIGDIRGVESIEKDETLYSLWQKVGPGEPCDGCGRITRKMVKLVKEIDGRRVETNHELKKMTEEEMKAIPLQSGDRLLFTSPHLCVGTIRK